VIVPAADRLLKEAERSRPAPAPDQPPAPILSLQRGVGNQAVARMLDRQAAAPERATDKTLDEDFELILSDAMLTLAMAGGGGAGRPIALAAPVGRGGANLRRDVAAVCARLLGLGFNPGGTLTDLEAAIERYQREVVGLRRADGRVDPGGRTVAALSQAKRAPAPDPAQAPAAEPVSAPSGPRAPLADAALERLVAGNPAAESAAAELAGLERRFKGAKRANGNEETGQNRDDLVAGLASLRAHVARLEPALQPHFYRAMNAISPYYFQKNNIILEFDRKDGTHVWNTCNISSLAMTLEALGKTAADYKYKHLIPPIAEVFATSIDEKAKDKVGAELTGLRLPDFVAMAAIVWQMGYQTGDREAIYKGGNAAFNKVPSANAIITLAKDFGVPARYGEFKLDKAARNDPGSRLLKGYGTTHWKRGDRLAKGELTEGTIEDDVPLQTYKQNVLADLRPHLDAGRQVVVAQHNHYVRLQAVTDEFVVKDDPGRFTHANAQPTWEEARALGMFQHWIAIG
jgi:hypothetical protein